MSLSISLLQICATIGNNCYVINVSRRLSLTEMIRLQGACPQRLAPGMQCITKSQMGQICGNAMSVPVFQEILRWLLPSVGLTHPFWDTCICDFTLYMPRSVAGRPSCLCSATFSSIRWLFNCKKCYFQIHVQSNGACLQARTIRRGRF